MNRVEPIRDIMMVKNIGRYLRETNRRDYIMYLIGIYSGLRISDILKLKVEDVKGRNNISLIEVKTEKKRLFTINPFLKKELKAYIEEYCLDDDDFLMKSRKGYNEPIHRATAYKILNKAADYFSLSNIGTHTLRKTFGYHFYLQTKDVVTLQRIFNHGSPATTLIYIGIEQDYIDEKIAQFRLF